MTKYKNTFISNIYYMLAYAYQDLRHEAYEQLQTEHFENVPDLLAAILAKAITYQLKQGLNREYAEVHETLSTLRGKVNVAGSIRTGMRNRRQLHCIYDELSVDHLMNRILKTTALRLIHCERVKRENRAALKRAVLFFSGVEELGVSSIPWHMLSYHRNNSSYRMQMDICYLVLNDLLLTTEQGERKLANFLDDQRIERLFEKFVLNYYRTHHSQYRPAAKQIAWEATGMIDLLPKMQSDIMLTNGDRKMIIDAKFYGKILNSQYDTDTYRSAHIYQIFSYIKNEDRYNTGLVDGMLLYAQTEDEPELDTHFTLGKNMFSIKTLNLNVNFAKIKKQLDSIIEEWSFSK